MHISVRSYNVCCPVCEPVLRPWKTIAYYEDAVPKQQDWEISLQVYDIWTLKRWEDTPNTRDKHVHSSINGFRVLE